jgi:hypothetical protein
VIGFGVSDEGRAIVFGATESDAAAATVNAACEEANETDAVIESDGAIESASGGDENGALSASRPSPSPWPRRWVESTSLPDAAPP